MNEVALTMVVKEFDFLAPFAWGDVVPEGIDLTFERDTERALDRFLVDRSILFGELSVTRHLIRMARGDRSYVGIPFFPTRTFVHRAFYVRRGSGLRRVDDLAGTRIATNDFPGGSNVWTRLMLRDHSVRIEEIEWIEGWIEGTPAPGPRSPLPSYVRVAPPDWDLRQMLVDGELDALMCPLLPKGFYDPDSPIVRLYSDYRRAEQEYYRRSNLLPAHHLFGVRRELYERHPWVLRSLYVALDRAKRRWFELRRRRIDTTPWVLADIEEATALIGPDWNPSGVEANRRAIQALADHMLFEGLIERPVDAATVFTEFEGVMRG